VSHQPERKEKNCLNCGAEVQGRYCHVCGQENIVVKQNFWSLTAHFVYDIFHFDGKFFDTLRHLFFKPGTISKEYIAGKRQSYLDPIRMYLFTSAVFFLIFFSMKSPDSIVELEENDYLSRSQRMNVAMEIGKRQQERPGDTVLQQQLLTLLDSSNIVSLLPLDDSVSDDTPLYYGGKAYRMVVEKDSNFAQLNTSDSSGWFNKTLDKKWGNFKKKYKDDLDQGLTDFVLGMVHKLPYLLFLSLPFFAGILKLLHLRKKQFYYSDHAVFTLHHYIISFILMLAYFLFDYFYDTSGWRIFALLSSLMFILWPFYLLVGMKRFYGQGWLVTLGKFLLVNFLGLVVMMLLMFIFLVFSIFQL
jgi:hypothetical protein